MSVICSLIDRLAAHGVTVRLAGDKIRVRRPEPVPAELEPLLAELKARRDEVVAYLRGREQAGAQPHPSDCVCLDCLGQHLFREGAGPDCVLPETHQSPGPVRVIRRNGYETRSWIPAHEIEWLWDNTRPVERKLTPVQEYIRGRIAGIVPPPDPPAAVEESYRDTLPAGVSDPADFRWDSDRQGWVHDPGWWRRPVPVALHATAGPRHVWCPVPTDNSPYNR